MQNNIHTTTANIGKVNNNDEDPEVCDIVYEHDITSDNRNPTEISSYMALPNINDYNFDAEFAQLWIIGAYDKKLTVTKLDVDKLSTDAEYLVTLRKQLASISPYTIQTVTYIHIDLGANFV